MNTKCFVVLLEVISSTTSSAIISHCSGLDSEGVTVVAVVFGGRSTTSTSSLEEEFVELFGCGVGRERLSFSVGQVGFVLVMVSVDIVGRFSFSDRKGGGKKRFGDRIVVIEKFNQMFISQLRGNFRVGVRS